MTSEKTKKPFGIRFPIKTKLFDNNGPSSSTAAAVATATATVVVEPAEQPIAFNINTLSSSTRTRTRSELPPTLGQLAGIFRENNKKNTSNRSIADKNNLANDAISKASTSTSTLLETAQRSESISRKKKKKKETKKKKKHHSKKKHRRRSDDGGDSDDDDGGIVHDDVFVVVPNRMAPDAVGALPDAQPTTVTPAENQPTIVAEVEEGLEGAAAASADSAATLSPSPPLCPPPVLPLQQQRLQQQQQQLNPSTRLQRQTQRQPSSPQETYIFQKRPVHSSPSSPEHQQHQDSRHDPLKRRGRGRSHSVHHRTPSDNGNDHHPQHQQQEQHQHQQKEHTSRRRLRANSCSHMPTAPTATAKAAENHSPTTAEEGLEAGAGASSPSRRLCPPRSIPSLQQQQTQYQQSMQEMYTFQKRPIHATPSSPAHRQQPGSSRRNQQAESVERRGRSRSLFHHRTPSDDGDHPQHQQQEEHTNLRRLYMPRSSKCSHSSSPMPTSPCSISVDNDTQTISRKGSGGRKVRQTNQLRSQQTTQVNDKPTTLQSNNSVNAHHLYPAMAPNVNSRRRLHPVGRDFSADPSPAKQQFQPRAEQKTDYNNRLRNGHDPPTEEGGDHESTTSSFVDDSQSNNDDDDDLSDNPETSSKSDSETSSTSFPMSSNNPPEAGDGRSREEECNNANQNGPSKHTAGQLHNLLKLMQMEFVKLRAAKLAAVAKAQTLETTLATVEQERDAELLQLSMDKERWERTARDERARHEQRESMQASSMSIMQTSELRERLESENAWVRLQSNEVIKGKAILEGRVILLENENRNLKRLLLLREQQQSQVRLTSRHRYCTPDPPQLTPGRFLSNPSGSMPPLDTMSDGNATTAQRHSSYQQRPQGQASSPQHRLPQRQHHNARESHQRGMELPRAAQAAAHQHDIDHHNDPRQFWNSANIPPAPASWHGGKPEAMVMPAMAAPPLKRFGSIGGGTEANPGIGASPLSLTPTPSQPKSKTPAKQHWSRFKHLHRKKSTSTAPTVRNSVSSSTFHESFTVLSREDDDDFEWMSSSQSLGGMVVGVDGEI